MGRFIDLTGKKFGRLTVLERAENRRIGKQSKIYWTCECDCGKIIEVDSGHLKSGHTKSCGCYQLEQSRNSLITHGLSKSRINNIWFNIIQRCENPNHIGYKDYGGRGIKMCDEWRSDFVSFKEWAYNNGYVDNLSIDRINVDGNYEPENCRWATNKEQANNTRFNIFLTYQDKTLTISEWADFLGVKAGTLRFRKRKGWSDERTLTQPVKNNTLETYDVTFYKLKGKWKVFYRIDGCKKQLGFYDTKEEAIQAKLIKIKELYGYNHPQSVWFDKYNI